MRMRENVSARKRENKLNERDGSLRWMNENKKIISEKNLDENSIRAHNVLNVYDKKCLTLGGRFEQSKLKRHQHQQQQPTRLWGNSEKIVKTRRQMRSTRSFLL